MDFFQTVSFSLDEEKKELELSPYLVLLVYNETNLNINIQYKEENANQKEFMPLQLIFKNKYEDYISNFIKLINEIKNQTIIICIEEKIGKNYLEIKFQRKKKDNQDEIIISEKIYSLNIEYYLTKGPNNERLYPEPFSSYILKRTINLKEIPELFEREKISDCYIIDNIRYFNQAKKAFQKLKQNRIPIRNKIILEFHIAKERNALIKNIKWTKAYYNEEFKKITKRLNKFTDKISKYDFIYLYASPIVEVNESNNNTMSEFDSPISYFKEIKCIFDIIRKSNKKFNCKFECADENTFKEVLNKNKAKILHISSHGEYKEEQYNLILENYNSSGEYCKINFNRLKIILDSANNLNQYDLIILTSCFSEHLGRLFLENGAKNVIFINGKTEVMDKICIKFTYYFYNNLIKGYSIKKSYDNTIKSLQENPEIANINYFSSSCKNHYHEKNCYYKYKNIGVSKRELCKCKLIPNNYHYIDCKYIKQLKSIDENFNTKFKKAINMYNTCCCCLNEDIEHDEILKIKYPQENDYKYISPLKYNGRGQICVNDSKIKFYFDTKKTISIITRRVIMGKITKSVNENNENNKFAILYGEKELEKNDFAETLCVYLYERKKIDSYEIISIASEFDFNNLKNDFNKFVDNRKKIKVIKLDNVNEEINFNYFIQIYKEFYQFNNNNEFFVFLFDYNEENKMAFESNLNKYISNNNINISLEKDKNLFYAGIDEKELLKNLTSGYDIRLSDEEKNLIAKKGKKNPNIIKNISELLIHGEKLQKINEMTEQDIINKVKIFFKLKENKQIYELYYLLLIMPSGLPNTFLNLLFEDYNKIIDEENLISENKEDNSNWKIIDKEKKIKVNLEEFKNNEACNICLFKALKYYTMILIYFIEKNREKVNNDGGTFHYLFNSYSTEKIWKYKTFNIIERLLNKKILKKDFNIQKHKDNIRNLISFIIENLVAFRNIKGISKEIDFYLEDILLLFPSYFFLDVDNIKILENCIKFVDILISKKVDENSNKTQNQLKLKLLLFLYSINESKNELIIKEEDELFLEYSFLKEIRKKEKNVIDLENILKHENITNNMKLNLYYEIAKEYYKKDNYEKCLEYFNKALESEEIMSINNDVKQNRIMLDYCYLFKKKYKHENKDNYNEIKSKAKSLKEIIINPSQKDIYYEAVSLRNEIYDLLKPDIVILNSNPLIKNISNYLYSPNNQYYILSELKKDIKHHIRIKSKILNKENLNLAFKEKGEILIIQSDDYTEKGEIVCETENGESEILKMEDLINMIKNKNIKFNNYKVVILCFPKSSILQEHLDKNSINYQYMISFRNIEEIKEKNMIKQFNKKSIQFIIDFIKKSLDNNNNRIGNIIEASKEDSIKNNDKEREIEEIEEKKEEKINLKFDDYIYFSHGNVIDSQIEYNSEFNNYNKIFLYDSFPKLNTVNSFRTVDEYSKDYSLEVYNLIKYIKFEKKKIFYAEVSNKRIYLKMSFDVMEFFYRHKTFSELFYIDITKENDINLLKSVIRKLKILKKVKNYNKEEENDEEKYFKKACFLLIANCKWEDLISINIYSILKSNSSFIIIIDRDERYQNHQKDEVKGKVKEDEEEAFIINNLNSDKVFLMIFDYDKIMFVDDEMIYAYYEKYEEEIELNENNLKSVLINTKIDILQYGNLYQDLKSGIPLEGEEYVFPFDLEEIKLFYYKILKLVEKLHNNNYFFLKIEPSYIMFDQQYNPILINLGNTLGIEGNLEKNIYINEYTPLELYEKDKNINKPKIDIFNLGILLFELLFRQKPFQVPINKCPLYDKIIEAKNDNYNEFWDQMNENLFKDWKNNNDIADFKVLFVNMIASDPNNRCSIGDIINSNFMKGTKKIYDEKEDRKILDEKIKEKFNGLRNDVIKKENTEIIIGKEIIEEKQPQKGEQKQIIKEGIPDVIKNNIIKIELNDKNPNDLMRELHNWIQGNTLNTKSVAIVENKIEVKIADKKEYSIELFKTINEKKKYFMKFDYFDGSLSEFNDRIELTRGYLENLTKEQKV